MRKPELMDDPSLPAAEHRAALRGLARINSVAMTNRVMASRVLAEVRRIAAETPRAADTPMRVLDIATGGGDLPVAIALAAKASGLNVTVHGCDFSPIALQHAANLAAGKSAAVQWFSHDIVAADLPEQYDIITCGLFLHHLDEPEIVTVLARLARATDGVLLVQDLQRSSLGLLMARVVPKLLTRSPVVHVDAVLSVQGALTMNELESVAGKAGLLGATVTALFPQRMQLRYDAKQAAPARRQA